MIVKAYWQFERATESNRRYYNDDHIQQLQLIFLLKQFGCTLTKLKRYYTKIAICRRLKQCCNCIRKIRDKHSRSNKSTKTFEQR